MSNYVELAEKAGDRYLATLAASQEGYLSYLSLWSRWLPKRPGYMGRTPNMLDMAGAWFAYSEQLLAQQKDYSDKLVASMSSAGAVTTKSAPAAKAPAAGSKATRAKRTRAKRGAVKRATTKKVTAKAASKKATTTRKTGVKLASSKSAPTAAPAKDSTK